MCIICTVKSLTPDNPTLKFEDHFSGHAGDYARYRPGYPAELFAWIAAQAPATRLAWDCGCGSGQAASLLACYFDRVVASDASRQQVAAATGPANVVFRVASAEHSGLAAGQVDAICVAQALHWFDLQAFFRECRRVATPSGLLCVWTYGSVAVAGTDNELLQDFEHRQLAGFWPEQRRLVHSGYAGIDLPGVPIEAPGFAMQVRWDLPRLLGYVRSWSAVRRCHATTGYDPVDALESRLAANWGDPGAERTVTWPLRVVASRL